MTPFAEDLNEAWPQEKLPEGMRYYDYSHRRDEMIERVIDIVTRGYGGDIAVGLPDGYHWLECSTEYTGMRVAFIVNVEAESFRVRPIFHTEAKGYFRGRSDLHGVFGSVGYLRFDDPAAALAQPNEARQLLALLAVLLEETILRLQKEAVH